MRAARLLGWEIAHHTRVFWRVPVAAFFTVAFPLMFLVLFNLLNRGGTVTEVGGIPFPQFFTPGIAVFAMVTAGYTNLAITTAIDRDDGILKRVLGTPLPPPVYIAGRVLAAVGTGLVSVVLMVAIGMTAFGVELLWSRIPTAVVVLVVGAAAFSALGLAVAGAAPNGQAAPAIANATLLPLALVSGIFFPMDVIPGWMQQVVAVLPLRPFVAAFVDQWNPAIAPGFPWLEVGLLVAWGAVGTWVAARTFSWEPRPGGGRRRS